METGHHYVTIYGSNMVATIVYDLDRDRDQCVRFEGTVTPEFNQFRQRVIDLLKYIGTDYSYSRMVHILSQIKSLSTTLGHPDNDDHESVSFGLFQGTLCYQDNEDDEPDLIKRINRTETEHLFSDNAQSFVIDRDMWPYLA